MVEADTKALALPNARHLCRWLRDLGACRSGRARALALMHGVSLVAAQAAAFLDDLSWLADTLNLPITRERDTAFQEARQAYKERDLATDAAYTIASAYAREQRSSASAELRGRYLDRLREEREAATIADEAIHTDYLRTRGLLRAAQDARLVAIGHAAPDWDDPDTIRYFQRERPLWRQHWAAVEAAYLTYQDKRAAILEALSARSTQLQREWGAAESEAVDALREAQDKAAYDRGAAYSASGEAHGEAVRAIWEAYEDRLRGPLFLVELAMRYSEYLEKGVGDYGNGIPF